MLQVVTSHLPAVQGSYLCVADLLGFCGADVQHCTHNTGHICEVTDYRPYKP